MIVIPEFITSIFGFLSHATGAFLCIPGCLIILLAGSVPAFSQPTRVNIITQPVPGSGNGAFMPVQPVVEITDAATQRITTSTAQVKIVISSGTGGTLGGTTSINAVNGVATFTDLTFSGLPNEPYVFEFKSQPVIAFEPFDYSGGSSLTGNNGGTGWSSAWYGPNGAFPDLTVDGPGLSYPGFSSSGGRAIYESGNGGDGARQLAAISNATDNTVWLAFLGNYDEQGGGFSNVRLYLPAGLSGGVGGNGGISNWSILNDNLNSAAGTSIPLDGSLHLALLKIDYTAGNSSLWLDPDVATFDGSQSPSTSASVAPVFDRVEIYNRYFDASTDEITLASTYRAALHLEQNLASDFSIAATLPVRWNYFTATCNACRTLLKWGTANEKSNDYFIVERSLDALTWLIISQVRGAGTISVDQQYEFADSAFSTKMFYRLRQTDIDGRFYLSKTVAADCERASENVMRIFPNPATDFLQITGATPMSRYELRNAQGQLMVASIITSGNVTISLAKLSEGNYILKVIGATSRPVHILKVKRN